LPDEVDELERRDDAEVEDDVDTDAPDDFDGSTEKAEA
jgi:hypothetical protein